MVGITITHSIRRIPRTQKNDQTRQMRNGRCLNINPSMQKTPFLVFFSNSIITTITYVRYARTHTHIYRPPRQSVSLASSSFLSLYDFSSRPIHFRRCCFCLCPPLSARTHTHSIFLSISFAQGAAAILFFSNSNLFWNPV